MSTRLLSQEYVKELQEHIYVKIATQRVVTFTTDIYARADSKAKREALEKAYTNLTPDKSSDKAWERNQNLRDWLKGLKK